MLMGLIALSVAIALHYMVSSQPKGKNCSEFAETQAVEVVAGHWQGAEGLVFSSKLQDGTCLYKVRGQRGVETPFVEWFKQDELDDR